MNCNIEIAMLKSKQRMDFNMTSNHQKNIPPKKRTRSLLKLRNPNLPRLRGLLRPKKADARSSAKPHRRRAYLDDFRKTQNGDYQYEGSRYACELSEKEWKKTIHRDGGSRNRGPPADDRRRLRAVGGTAGKRFRAASICSAAGGSLQPRVGMCKALGQA